MITMVLAVEEETVVSYCIVIIALAVRLLQRPRLRWSCWTRPWIFRRQVYGAHHALIKELRNEDPKSLKSFLRTDMATFEELLQLVTRMIKKSSTKMREPIPPAERLSLTFRFLATGKNFLNYCSWRC